MQDKIGIYPGTFDPITNGHVSVIERAAHMFDKVILAMAVNSKKVPLFSNEERIEMARESLKHIENVEVEITKTLMVDFLREKGAVALIRGIRAVSDFEYEFQIALMNKKLEENCNTIFLMPDEKYTYLNSSIIRELARYGQDLSDFVHPFVAEKLRQKFIK
jgi:pantetheine-phosphate adenylyltransferase